MFAVSLFGCILALALGDTMATEYGVLLVSAIVSLAFCAIAIVIYARDPVLALIWLWLFVIFNGSVSAAVGYESSAGQAVRQTDEVLVLLFVGLTIWRTLRTQTCVPPLRFIFPVAGVALFGVLGDYLHNVPLGVTLVGAWLGLKLWIMIVVSLMLPWKRSDLTRVYVVATRIGAFVAVLGLVDFLTDSAVSRVLHTANSIAKSGSFRSEAVHSILPQAGEYSLFMSLLFAFTFARFATKRSRYDLALAVLFAGSVMLSLRLKGVLSLAAVVIIIALAQVVTNDRGAIVALLTGSLLFIGVYSVEANVVAKQVAIYSSSESSPRSLLYRTSERIASDDFPLGVGFGRFASYPSRLYYSPVYYQYELSAVQGLAHTGPDFIDDTSWPSVIGETGFAGFGAYLAGVVLLIFTLMRRFRHATPIEKWVPLSALCAVGVLLVDSLGNSTLFDWLACVTFAMMVGPAMIATRARSDQRY